MIIWKLTLKNISIKILLQAFEDMMKARAIANLYDEKNKSANMYIVLPADMKLSSWQQPIIFRNMIG
jgi:hypothetical protein